MLAILKICLNCNVIITLYNITNIYVISTGTYFVSMFLTFCVNKYHIMVANWSLSFLLKPS